MDSPKPAPRFFAEHVLPALLVLVIPIVSIAFFGYAERDMDRSILASLENTITQDTTSTEAEKSRARTQWRSTPVSKIMASSKPELAAVQAIFEPSKNRYATFRWMKRIGWICLGSVLATLLLVGAGVAWSFKSAAAQYWSLRLGWPILRTSASIQVIGQAVLMVFLSFWVTAIVAEIYSLKLILVVAGVALLMVGALIKAIFRKVEDECEVEGKILTEEEAPALWTRIREMATKLQTTPPDRVIVGIAPSFFVTEHPVRLQGEQHEGRTLYLSLPMLKILSIAEADAVLGHELAHFSGDDTLWSRKISPLMGRFTLYLQSLGAPVAQFMHVFWKLFMLSLGRRSREREFRADQVGASLVSADAMRRALIKVAGYCEYRAKTECAVIEQNRLNPDLRLAHQLELGYSGFLKTFTSGGTAEKSETPHPFDSHPPLNQRLEGLGLEALQALKEDDLHAPIAGTWHDAMPSAHGVEQEMWAAREALIHNVHSQDLAWRLLPTGPEETEMVLAHFPERTFTGKKGAGAKLTYEGLHLSTWPALVPFAEIEGAQMEDTITGKLLVLFHREEEGGKMKQLKFRPADFVSEQGPLLPAFELYYGRHQSAKARSLEAVTLV